MQHRLYQDEERNFTLQDSKNTTIAIFSVHYSSEGYSIRTTDSRETIEKNNTQYSGIDEQEAIVRAYALAKEFARQLDPDFEDLTQLGELERKTQPPEPQRVLKLKTILTNRITREQLGNLQKKSQ